MNEMKYYEDSSSIGISSHEKLSDDEKINIIIGHLTFLSDKYGLGEVNFWYEPFSDGYKNFSIKISPDKSADELIDLYVFYFSYFFYQDFDLFKLKS